MIKCFPAIAGGVQRIDFATAVLVAEDDWRAVQETLHLLSVPGMRESILEGMETPIADLERELDW